jgi:hypothetical protein
MSTCTGAPTLATSKYLVDGEETIVEKEHVQFIWWDRGRAGIVGDLIESCHELILHGIVYGR